MKKSVTLFLFLLIAGIVSAQNFDSLYGDYQELKKPPIRSKPVISFNEAAKYKCAFSLVSKVKLNYEKFTASQKNVLTSLFFRPVSDTSVITPSGYFRIHYDLKGQNKPAYDLNSLALSLDSAYAFEIGYLNYPVPPSDNGAGGDDKYDVYIQDLSGYYGYTELEGSTQEGHYYSYMVIDNDFSANYTKGINAAKVTVAHEFFHAIQIGGYTYRSSDDYYHEISSTAMEDFVFDYVNDYFFYMPDYFHNHEITISGHNGYDLAILNMFIKERLGYSALKRIWENINNYRALQAINIMFEENNTSFKNEFSNFNMWTFFTGYRSISGKYFKDARYYPVLNNTMAISYSPPQKMVMLETLPVSNNLLLFVSNFSGNNDSVYAIISNADYMNGFENTLKYTHCDYYLYSSYQEGLRRISSDYFVKIESPVPDLLKDVNMLNNQLVVEENVSYEAAESPFPQPFNYSRHNNVAVPAPNGVSEEALLYIYTLNMKLVYSGSLKVIKTDKLFVRWSGLDDKGSRLPNGVYFYVVKRDDSIIKGKVVIQNE